MVTCKFCKRGIGDKRNGGSFEAEVYLTLYGFYEPEKDKAELYIESEAGYHIEAKNSKNK